MFRNYLLLYVFVLFVLFIDLFVLRGSIQGIYENSLEKPLAQVRQFLIYEFSVRYYSCVNFNIVYISSQDDRFCEVIARTMQGTGFGALGY